MRRPGRVIENPVTGERARFTVTGAESGGQLLQIELTVVAGGGFVSPRHRHPQQAERFLVRSGELTLTTAGTARVLRAGEAAEVAAGVAHGWGNSGDEPLRVTLEFRPAGRFEAFLTTLFALAQDGRVDGRGMPNLLQRAVTLQAYADTVRLAEAPYSLQRLAFAALAPLARALGYAPDRPYPHAASAPDLPAAPTDE